MHHQFFKELRAEEVTSEDNGIATDIDYSDDEEHGEELIGDGDAITSLQRFN